jgi:hypothetical protein
VTTLIAIDPGLRVAGAAVFENAVLTWAGLVRNPVKKERGPEAWMAMAREVEKVVYVKANRNDALVTEYPQVYRGPRQKGDPADLIELTGVAGAISGVLQAETSRGFLPREWKGATPKTVHNARVLARLTADEKTAIDATPPSLIHNVIDAVGIGLFYLGRLK